MFGFARQVEGFVSVAWILQFVFWQKEILENVF